MADNLPVSIGGIQLLGTEVPSFFDRGGELRTVSLRTISGDRVIQVLGSQPAKRELVGYFLGAGAIERAGSVEAMRDAAIPVLLSIGIWTEYVLVTKVTLRYAERGAVVAYAIEAESLVTPLQQVVTTAVAVTGMIAADLAQGIASLGSVAQIGSQQVASALGGLQSGAAGGFAAGSIVVGDFSTPSTSLMGLIGSAGRQVLTLSSRAPSGSLVANGPDLQQAVAQSSDLAAFVQAGAYVNRAEVGAASLTGTSFSPAIHS